MPKAKLKVGDLVEIKNPNEGWNIKNYPFLENKAMGIVVKVEMSEIQDQTFNMDFVPTANVRWSDGDTTNTCQSFLKVIARVK